MARPAVRVPPDGGQEIGLSCPPVTEHTRSSSRQHHANSPTKPTSSPLWRLESGGAAPGIDLIDRLAVALGTTAADLLRASQPADSLPVLRDQARMLFEKIMVEGDRETLLLLNPLLNRLPLTSPRTPSDQQASPPQPSAGPIPPSSSPHPWPSSTDGSPRRPA